MCRKSEVPALHALPTTVLRQTIERLNAGQTVAAVARWLMTQDRGELQHQGFYEIRKQVAQLKGHVDRNEDMSVDPRLEALRSAYEVQFQKLSDKAMASCATARGVLNFVLVTELKRLHDLHQNGGSHDQTNALLQHIRRIGEQLCNADRLGFGTPEREITIEGADPARVQQAEEAVAQMSAGDRMLILQAFKYTREILKAARKQAAEESSAPPAGPGL